MITPVSYWRANQSWRSWLNRQGEVVEVTTVTVPVPELIEQAPYQYALVDFGTQRKGLMVAAGSQVEPGDKVVTVLRKLAQPSKQGVIQYGLKVEKV